ncbi:MAG TPA: peptidoglycan-binding protein, partial [Clostridiales bacterium]|nr:peptidoglycan-binding protein [Clostridiales bacterium]
MKSKRLFATFLIVFALCFSLAVSAAADGSYTVVSGDSLWKIAAKN